MIYRIRELILVALLVYTSLLVHDLSPHLFAHNFTVIFLVVGDALFDAVAWAWRRFIARLEKTRGT